MEVKGSNIIQRKIYYYYKEFSIGFRQVPRR